MKKISAETTRYMMDAMAYVFTAAFIAATDKEPTAEEVNSNVRELMELYCRAEGIEPTYDDIVSRYDNFNEYAWCKTKSQLREDYEGNKETEEEEIALFEMICDILDSIKGGK